MNQSKDVQAAPVHPLSSAARPPMAIFGTDLAKQPDVLIEHVRSVLSHARGQLSDIRNAYGWHDRIQDHEGALTVVIASLSLVANELTRHRREHGDCQYVS